jgi:hypothetical protein
MENRTESVSRIRIDGRHVLVIMLFVLVSYHMVCTFYFRYDTFTWLDKTLFDPIDWHYFLDANKASPYFTPIGNVLFFVLYKLFGLESLWYHVCMLAIHALNAFLVYCLAIRLLRSGVQAFVAALLFGIFPAHVDAVVYVATIHHTLATTFTLLSLLSFVQFLESGKRLHFSLLLVFTLLGLLTKQIASVIPALCAGCEYVSLGKRMSKSSLTKYVPSVLIVAIYLAVNGAVNRANTAYAPIHATYYRVDGHMLGSFAQYIGFMASPVDNLIEAVATRFLPILQALYPYLRAVLVAVLLVCAAYYATKRREVRFSLLWVAVALLPSLPFVFPPQSRYVYLASVGFCLMLASMVTTRGTSSKLAQGVILAVVAAYSLINLANMVSFAGEYGQWRQWLSEIQSHHASLPPESDLYLIDFPRLAISRDDEISAAVRVTLGNPTLRVHAVSHEEYGQVSRSDAVYGLRYDENGHFTDPDGIVAP